MHRLFLRMWILLFALSLFAFSSVLASGCGDDDDDDDDSSSDDDADDDGGEDDLDAESCEHMTEGPFVDVTAAANTEGDVEAVADDHTAYVVEFVSVGEDGSGGFVAFNADESGDFVFFLSADVPFTVLGSDGATEIAIEETSAVDACAEVAMEHVVELSVGAHFLFFGPTDASGVSVVIEHGAHEHDE